MNKKFIRTAKDEVVLMTFDEVIKAYKGLIIRIISKWIFKYEFDDLYQMGSVGLWDAYKYHDSNNGYTFGTLAEKTILNYISWYRQNNNLDKIKRETSQISDISSYDSVDGYKNSFEDKANSYKDAELKIIIAEILIRLKEENKNLKSHEMKASERNIEFLKLISYGITQREIAENYKLSISTVQRGLYKEFKRIKKLLRTERLIDVIL